MPQNPSPLTGLVIPPDTRPPLSAFGSTIRFVLGAGETAGSLAVGLAVTPPGVSPPPHVHHKDDELFLVLEGEMSFLVAGDWVVATPGTAVYLPRGVPHTFRNTGATPSRHWVITTPSGFEEFYARSAGLFAQGAPDPQALGRLATEYGYELLGARPEGGPAADSPRR